VLLDPCDSPVSSALRDVGFSLLSLFVGTIEVLAQLMLGSASAWSQAACKPLLSIK
jgi:hypothetical protein